MSLDSRRSKIIRRPLLAFPLAFLATLAAFAADGDDNENAADFAVLCRLMRLAERGYNESGTVDNKVGTDFENSIKKATALADFNETNIKLHKKQKSFGLKEEDKPLPHSDTAKAIAIKINRTAAIADALLKSIKDSEHKTKQAKKRANDKLNKALYGTETNLTLEVGTTETILQTHKSTLFGTGPEVTKNCGGGDAKETGRGEHTGITIINDIFCLCIAGEGIGKKICETQGTTMQAQQAYSQAQKTTINQNWRTLLKACPRVEQPITSMELTGALEAFFARLGANAVTPKKDKGIGKRNVLGYIDDVTQGCTGAVKQTCVNYAYHLQAEQPKQIPWVNSIREAIREERQIADQHINAHAAQQQLASLNETVWDLYDRAFETQQKQATESRERNSETSKPKAIAADKPECGKHKDNKKACTEAKCIWKGKDGTSETEGECKPKDGEGQTNTAAGTEGGAAGTTASATGNNSFVINKAPLWLAVLLF